jgi:aspartate/methionine/tyrosine aminotransferase
LQALSEDKSRTAFQPGLKLVYGPIRGSLALRSNLASLYSAKTASPLPTDNVLITAGGINANFLAFYTLLTKGDHVICHYPTYQQLYSVPSSLGAEVSLWKTTPERQWQPDIEELKALIKPHTKMIIIK